jgi:hypothetical protein
MPGIESTSPFGRVLYRHPRVTIALYAVVVVAFLGFLIQAGATWLALLGPTAAELARGEATAPRPGDKPGSFTAMLVMVFLEGDAHRRWLHIALAVVFLAGQFLVIAGLGCVRLPRARSEKPTVAASIVFVSLMVALVTVGALLTVLEAVGVLSLIDKEDLVESQVLETPGEPWAWLYLTPLGLRWLGGLILAGWAMWGVVALAAWRRTGGGSVLERMVAGVLVGSWVEFVAALAVEIGARDRGDECPCDNGSWLALTLATPVMIWAIGPAMFMVYQRERSLVARDPSHARRVLREKTRVRG